MKETHFESIRRTKKNAIRSPKTRSRKQWLTNISFLKLHYVAVKIHPPVRSSLFFNNYESQHTKLTSYRLFQEGSYSLTFAITCHINSTKLLETIAQRIKRKGFEYLNNWIMFIQVKLKIKQIQRFKDKLFSG